MKRHAKALVAVVIACLSIGAGTALALNGHVPSPSNPFLTGLGNPQALTVDQSNGDLYVLDVGDSTVKRFDSSGAPAEFSALGSNAIDGTTTPQGGFAFNSPSGAQLAIDRSGGPADGYLYVTNTQNGAVNVFDNTGAYKGRLPNPGGEPCGVAVDNSGNVYVSNQGFGRIYKYNPAEDPADVVLERQIFETYGQCNIAVDSGENLYSVSNGGGEVRKYESSAFGQPAPTYAAFAPFATAINRDPSSDDIYLDEGTQVARYSSAGSLIQRFGGNDDEDTADELSESAGIALNSSSGTVYASDSLDAEVMAYVPALLPDATTGAATAVTGTTATLNGTVDPAGGPEADCEFKWGTEPGDYPNTALCTPAGPFTEATAASAEISGLEAGTVYHFQIVASSGEGENPGADRSFTTDGAPLVSGLSVSDVGLSSAVLHGTVNPAGSVTDYHFEYVTLEEFEANEFANATSVPVPGASLAAGSSPITVSQEIEGLSEQTAYRYRLVATNQVDSAATGSQTLTTHAPAGEFTLPEGRRWEMVSPREKEGADVVVEAGRTRALADGNKLFFTSLRPFGDALGSGISTEYMAERSADGWKTHAVTPLMRPQSYDEIIHQFNPRYVGELSDDGTTGVYLSHDTLAGPSNVSNVRNFYLRRDLDQPGQGTYELLSDGVAPIANPPATLIPAYAGASEDFSHIVFGSRINLTADAPAQPSASCLNGTLNACQPRLYEHTSSGVRLVGRIPPSGEVTCDDTTETPACQPAVRSIARQVREIGYPHWVISNDGNRIFFTVGTSIASTLGKLYVREGGSRTVQIDSPERTSPGSAGPSTMWMSSTDGSKAIFTTTAQLVDGDVDGDLDVYRFDLDQPEGSRLTLVSDGPGEVHQVYGASDDGEYIYFTNTDQLVTGAPALDELGSRGLFLWHAGEIRFVGTVTHTQLDLFNASENWSLNRRQARVTPDGKQILFISHALDALTGNVAVGFCGAHNEPCGRAYVYDADAKSGAGKLSCASCPPDGGRAASESTWTQSVEKGGSVSEGHLNQALTDDGRLAFFSTADPLVPGDSNGRYDVYAYDIVAEEPRLLSSGSCKCDSWFTDASPDGSDVFFTTREQLVGWDTDNLMDVYDARVGGGYPEPPPPPPTCAGDACQPPPVALNDPTPASSAFEGAGNLRNSRPPRRCGKNQHKVRANGKSRCVKKRGKRHGNRNNSDRRVSR